MEKLIELLLLIGFEKDSNSIYLYENYYVYMGDYYQLTKNLDKNNYFTRQLILHKDTSISEFKHNILKHFKNEIRKNNLKRILNV